MTERNFTTTVISDDDSSSCVIEIPFDPKPVFGKRRAAVLVTINDFSFPATIQFTNGQVFLHVTQAQRKGARIEGGQQIRVSLQSNSQAPE